MKKSLNLIPLFSSYIWIIQWIICIVIFIVFDKQLKANEIDVPIFLNKMNLLLIAVMLSLLISSGFLLFSYFKFKNYLKLEVKLISKQLFKLYSTYFISLVVILIINLLFGILTCVITLNDNNQLMRLILIIFGIVWSIIGSAFSSFIYYVLNLRIKYDSNKDLVNNQESVSNER